MSKSNLFESSGFSDSLSSADDEEYNPEIEKQKLEELGDEFDFQDYVEKLSGKIYLIFLFL